MNQWFQPETIRRTGVGLAFIFYPILAAFAFAVHPNLGSLAISEDPMVKISEFHGNTVLHFGHVLMTAAVPLLITIITYWMRALEERAPWYSLLGGSLAVIGAVALALDKAALCLVPSALDTLPEAVFQAFTPGFVAMFQFRGWLVLLHLLPLLPIGFVILAIGLLRTRLIPRAQSWPVLIGALLMLNPDIDLIGLIATLTLAVGFIPCGISLIRGYQYSSLPVQEAA